MLPPVKQIINTMVNFTYRGLCSPVFTIFNEDFSLNTKIIPQYAKLLLDNGVNGVLVNGTNGEGMSMSVDERKLLAAEWVKATKPTNQHVMVQVGGCPLPDVISLAKHAEKIGVGSLLCLPELYFKPSTSTELISYLKVVSQAAPNTPLVYYHNPPMSGVSLNMAKFMDETVGKLPTFVGIKYTSNDLDGAVAALRANNGKYTVFLGSNTVLAGAFALGFDSSISTTLNFIPQTVTKILKAVEDNNIEEAKLLQYKLSDTCNEVLKHGSWVPAMKTAMTLLTPINAGKARPPQANLTDEQIESMKKSFQKMSLIKQ